jgi:glycosyltransferase involved in cell wall biosynthesis
MNMKVALFSRYPLDSGSPKGGVESVTVTLVKALVQLGDLDVHIVTLERERRKILVERIAGATVHRLPGSRWPQIFDVLGGPGKRRLVRYITELAPNVLHVHETYGLGLGNISIPHVFTIHGFNHANLVADSAKFASMRSRLWKFAERRGLAAQRHIISISPYVREMIQSQTCANIYYIDNPVDERFFKIVRRPEPGRILCVGWINRRKNTLGAVSAFGRIALRQPEAKLVIAGEAKEAEYFDRVKHSIEQANMAERVELLGHVDYTRLVQELARASVFLLPSRQENSPMAIAEAMAAGLPVIASDRCGMPYMVREGQTGFLVDPESTEQIADRLTKLVDSHQLCQRMGQAGRQLAIDRFHPNTVAEKTRAVYDKICARA